MNKGKSKTKNNNDFQVNIKKIILSIFALTVVYFNLWVMLARSPAASIANKLPANKVVADVFDTFSVFSYYENINRDIVIKGLPEKSYGIYDADTWVSLDIDFDYFPYCLGEQQMRLYFSKHLSLGNEEFEKACKSMANKIRDRFNKEMPYYSMRKITIGAEVWPRSLAGYRHLKKSDTTSFQVLCVGDLKK